MRSIIKKYSLIIIILYFHFNVEGQIFVEGDISWNSFKMDDSKALQKDILSQFPVESKIVNAFPSYLGFQLTVGNQFKFSNSLIRLGVPLNFTSTGSRVSYADYSGSLAVDQLLRVYSVGVLSGIEQPLKARDWSLGFDMALLYNFTNFELKSRVVLGNVSDEDSQYFVSNGISVIPNIVIKRKISLFDVGLTFGYNFMVFKSPFALKKDRNLYLYLDNPDNPLKPNWNGLRLGVKAQYRF